MTEFFYLVILMLAGIAYVLGAFFVNRVLAPKSPDAEKFEPYECGEKPMGPAWLRFNVGFYIFALIFLIFEVETVFLFPWAIVLKKIGVIGLVEGFLFLGILIFGLIFAWRKGYLTWH
jgi:NADH-quinone oxidoreductase subunit A